ncbi:MAG: DNRLRE domain-containing protein [Candidatus Gribaldobacteria bacterium]|nr:DNRLRE domain-containing protein [Candidatus Gribaldobacteria bacterium]
MKILKSVLIVLFLIFATTATSSAKETLSFQFGANGYEAAMDTHITEYTANSSNNMGGNIENECCEYDPANKDGKSYLVYFNLSEVARNAVIAKATLEMNLTSTRNGANKKSVAAHQLLKQWKEGTGVGIDGVAAKKDEVCGQWTGADNELWDALGADSPDKDFVSKPSDTIEIAGDIGPYQWDITGMCQYWIQNPSKNFGVILREPRPHAATLGTKVFASKENVSIESHPKLIIEVSAYGVEVKETLATTWGSVKTRQR